jgi:hypothetical protein
LAYVTDNGKLPLSVTPPKNFLADPNHRKKEYGRAFYNLILKDYISVTKNDAEILKEYFGYTQKQYRNEPFGKVKLSFKAMFQHTFNEHSLCDSKGCKYHNNPLLTETEGKYKFRSVDSSEYIIMKEVHENIQAMRC